MRPSHRPARPSRARPAARVRPGAEWLAAAAVLALVAITAAVSVQGVRAERARRATAARALRDYAYIAAWHYVQGAQGEFHDAAQEIARPVAGLAAAGGAPPPPPEVLLPVARYSSRPRVAALARFAFRLDVRRDELRTAGGEAPDAVRRWIRTRLPSLAAAGGADSHGTALDTAGGQAWVFYYRKLPAGERGAPALVYGVAADGAAATERLAAVHRAAELLPPALAGPAPQGRLVGVRVLHPDGRVLYEAGPTGDALATGRDTAAAGQGGYTVVATLSAELARSSALGAGQLPARAAAATLVLSLLLAAVALAQLRRARQLARLRDRFVASVSHELRTPLTQISMFGETLMHGRERSPEERRHFAGVIFRESRRLAALVDNVLRFSWQEAEPARLATRAVALDDELRDAAAAFAPIAAAAGARVDVRVPAGLRAAADPAALRQVVVNLLDNAVKYGPRPQRVLVGATADGDQVCVAVEDEGPGVAPADRGRIFEPFVRLTRDGAPAVPGTGIGLAVVRDLARAMGGAARVEDAPGGGARFVVTLPAAPAGAPHDAAEASAAAVGGRAP